MYAVIGRLNDLTLKVGLVDDLVGFTRDLCSAAAIWGPAGDRRPEDAPPAGRAAGQVAVPAWSCAAQTRR